MKDLPLLSTLVDDESFVNRYWDAAQCSWKKTSSHEVLLQFSILLYRFMQEQQRYLSQIGVDFSQATKKLLKFITECLVDDKDVESLASLEEYDSVGELFTAFISVARKLSTVYIKNGSDGNLYFACSSAWTFVKVSSAIMCLKLGRA